MKRQRDALISRLMTRFRESLLPQGHLKYWSNSLKPLGYKRILLACPE